MIMNDRIRYNESSIPISGKHNRNHDDYVNPWHGDVFLFSYFGQSDACLHRYKRVCKRDAYDELYGSDSFCWRKDVSTKTSRTKVTGEIV